MEQNRSPEMNPHSYGQLNCDKGDKNIQCRKDRLFNKCCWENFMQKNETGALCCTIFKNKLKMGQTWM